MTWTSPPTFTDGAVLTGAQLNVLRDDLNETAPAKVTAAGQIVVATGANAIAARTPTQVAIATSETTTSTSYTDLATTGPVVTVTTGSKAVVFLTSFMGNTVGGAESFVGYNVSGASTVAESDARAVFYESSNAGDQIRCAAVHLETGLTPGSNNFTMRYKVSAGTGTFLFRNLFVIPL